MGVGWSWLWPAQSEPVIEEERPQKFNTEMSLGSELRRLLVGHSLNLFYFDGTKAKSTAQEIDTIFAVGDVDTFHPSSNFFCLQTLYDTYFCTDLVPEALKMSLEQVRSALDNYKEPERIFSDPGIIGCSNGPGLREALFRPEKFPSVAKLDYTLSHKPLWINDCCKKKRLQCPCLPFICHGVWTVPNTVALQIISQATYIVFELEFRGRCTSDKTLGLWALSRSPLWQQVNSISISFNSVSYPVWRKSVFLNFCLPTTCIIHALMYKIS